MAALVFLDLNVVPVLDPEEKLYDAMIASAFAADGQGGLGGAFARAGGFVGAGSLVDWLEGELISGGVLNSPKDIVSLTAFKRNSAEYVEWIKKSGKPLVLTVNGRAEVVVQDVEGYRRILEVVDRAEAAFAVREGIESVRRGKTMSLEQFDKRMWEKNRGLKRADGSSRRTDK